MWWAWLIVGLYFGFLCGLFVFGLILEADNAANEPPPELRPRENMTGRPGGSWMV